MDEVVCDLWDMRWDVRAEAPGEASCSLTHFGVVCSCFGRHVHLLQGGYFMAEELRRMEN